MSSGDRIPGAESLVVPPNKVTKYLLVEEHPDGGSKARFFLKRGFEIRRPEVMLNALKEHGQIRPVIKTMKTEFGTKYLVRCELQTPDGLNPCVRSVWIVRDGEAPTFVTAYPRA